MSDLEFPLDSDYNKSIFFCKKKLKEAVYYYKAIYWTNLFFFKSRQNDNASLLCDNNDMNTQSEQKFFLDNS